MSASLEHPNGCCSPQHHQTLGFNGEQCTGAAPVHATPRFSPPLGTVGSSGQGPLTPPSAPVPVWGSRGSHYTNNESTQHRRSLIGIPKWPHCATAPGLPVPSPTDTLGCASHQRLLQWGDLRQVQVHFHLLLILVTRGGGANAELCCVRSNINPLGMPITHCQVWPANTPLTMRQIKDLGCS